MNSDESAKLDQSLAYVGDMLPALWRRMFLRLREEGFTEDQAMAIVRTHVFATGGGKWVQP